MSATSPRLLFVLILACCLLPSVGADIRGVRISGPVPVVPPASAACTDGVDCYCDCATNAVLGAATACTTMWGSNIYDASVLSCEDFENANFYSTTDWVTGSGSGASYNRGVESDWFADYGGGSNGGIFTSSDTNPRIGTVCGAGSPGVVCSGIREYCSTAQGNLVDGLGADCWGPGVNAKASLDIQRAGDFDEANGALTLTGGHGGTADVGSGNTHMAYVLKATPGDNNGAGNEGFTTVTEVGITMAHAYASNLDASGILTYPWKHEEWRGTARGPNGITYDEFWNLGNTGHSTGGTYFPYMPFLWVNNNCATALAGATLHVGSAHCFGTGGSGTSFGLGMTANGSATFPIDGPDTEPDTAWQRSNVTNYTRAANFPDGTWACHRAHISGMGTSNTEIKIWHGSILVFHMSGFNGASAMRNQNYNNFFWNAYSNRTAESGTPGLLQTTYRYRDNVHIRNGAPVACSQIGY